MQLQIPLIRQRKNSVDCLLVGALMFLKHHNISSDYDTIKKEVETDNIGSYMPQVGTYLLKKGLQVNLITMHPYIFTRNDYNLTQEQIKERINSLHQKEKNDQNKKVLTYFIDFLKVGGTITPNIPNKDHIINEIQNNRPLGAALTTKFITSPFPGFNFHFNLITGIDDKHIYVNDPAWNENGGKKKHLIEEFFYCLHASIYGDIDNGCFIMVKKASNK